MTKPTQPKKFYQPEVDGLKMEPIKASIKWRGMVRMRLAGNDESLLGEAVWPKGSGRVYYACA